MGQVETITKHQESEISALLSLGRQILEAPANTALITKDSPEAGPKLTKSLDQLLRAGHQIHFVEYQGKEYIFKVFADLGKHSPKRHGFGRRLGFFFDNWLKNPAKRSYLGACTLKELDIPAIQPLAVLHGRWGIHRRGVFIYESIRSQYSAKDWLKSGLTDAQTNNTLKQICQITRSLEKSGYHFADFKLDNLLVEQRGSSFKLILIDTDEVLKAWSNKLPLPKCWQKLLNLWHLRRLKPQAPLDMEFLECHLSDRFHPYDLGTWKLIRDFQPNPFKWLKKNNKKARYHYRGYELLTHMSQDEAKLLLDSLLDQNYTVLKTYKDSQRSHSQHLLTHDGQNLVFKKPLTQYKRLGHRLRNIFFEGEANQQYLSMRLLHKLSLYGPEALLAAEKKNTLGIPTEGLVVYKHVQGQPAEANNAAHVEIIAKDLLKLHSYGYTRDDPRLNNYLINNNQVVFIDCILKQPVFFRKTRLRMEFIKFLRRYPEAFQYLHPKEQQSPAFHLTQKIKNIGRKNKKEKGAK